MLVDVVGSVRVVVEGALLSSEVVDVMLAVRERRPCCC